MTTTSVLTGCGAGALVGLVYTIPMFKSTRAGFSEALQYIPETTGIDAFFAKAACAGIGALVGVRVGTSRLVLRGNYSDALRTPISVALAVMSGTLALDLSDEIWLAGVKSARIISGTIRGFEEDVGRVMGLGTSEEKDKEGSEESPGVGGLEKGKVETVRDAALSLVALRSDEASLRAMMGDASKAQNKVITARLLMLKKNKHALKQHAEATYGIQLAKYIDSTVAEKVDRLTGLRFEERDLAVQYSVSPKDKRRLLQRRNQIRKEKAQLKHEATRDYNVNISKRAARVRNWRSIVKKK